MCHPYDPLDMDIVSRRAQQPPRKLRNNQDELYQFLPLLALQLTRHLVPST